MVPAGECRIPAGRHPLAWRPVRPHAQRR